MAVDAEMIADRRSLRRKLTTWRVLTFLVLILAVAGAGLYATTGAGDGQFAGRSQVARITVSGFIAGDQRVIDLFKRVGDASAVKGVVIAINSPGGTTSGSEDLFRGIRDLAAKKPTVAFVDGLAASGAYITALATDRIVARETAIVGSVGVLFQYPDFTGILGKVGVSVEEIKSSPLKAEPSGFHPTPPEARAALQSVVDALGSERDAIAWMEKERQVPEKLPVVDWKASGPSSFSLWSAASLVAEVMGFEQLSRALAVVSAPAVKLDGLLAVWQPPRDPRHDLGRAVARRPCRVARLRRLLGQEARRPRRPQSPHRRGGRRLREGGAGLQDREGHAPAPQPLGCRPRRHVLSRSMLGFLKALLLLPVAIVVVLLAIANRAPVTMSFDPFAKGAPELGVTLPLFAFLFAALVVGVVLGGIGAWLAAGKHRQARRTSAREIDRLSTEADRLRNHLVSARGSLPAPGSTT